MLQNRGTIEVATIAGGYAVVCHPCKYWIGQPAQADMRILDMRALLLALQHTMQHHAHEGMTVIHSSHYAVNVVLASGSSDNPELDKLIKQCSALYRALPHCILRKPDWMMDVQTALGWAKLTAKL